MTDNNLHKLIAQGENEKLEFKSSFNTEVIETLTAFANTKGGKVLIGINDAGKVVSSFSFNKETIPGWVNEIKNKTYPSLIPDVEIIEYESIKIVEFLIADFPIKPVSCKGKYFKRVENSNHQLNLTEISNLHLKTFNSSWDYYPDENHTIESISEEKIEKFLDLRNKNHIVSVDESLFTFLNKLELLRENKITNACFLLFTQKDTILSTIELGRFQDDITIKDAITIRQDLINEVDTVLEFILKHIRKEYVITGKVKRDEIWEYPLEALREIVLNMIVHRDYMHHGDSVIKIFDDRIEFYNPGQLPEGITVDDLLKGSYVSDCRNKLIAFAFKEIGWIEKYGSGIRRILKAFLDHGCRKPVFENFQQGFRVIVYSRQKVGERVGEKVGERVGENLTENQDKIIKLILMKNRISARELSVELGISQRKIEENISKLKEKGILQRIGPAKGGYWKINTNE